jgi:transcriptional regulator with XRE-family HTH domain
MTTPLYSEDYRAFVRHLVETRQRLGITQEQLGERLGKPQSYISKSERHERRIDVAEFRLFVIALGLEPESEFSTVASALALPDK